MSPGASSGAGRAASKASKASKAAPVRRARRPSFDVEVLGRLPDGVEVAAIRSQIVRTLARLRTPAASVTVRFAGDALVRRYNLAYRQVDASTDVLSFPLGDEVEGRLHLGDLLLSRDRVRAQAKANGLSERRETAELVLHGCLHLLGYDHETDDGEMDTLELDLRAELLDGGRGSS